MSTQSRFYVGYKSCGCPVAAVNADVARPQDLAESLAGMVKEGYRVEEHIGLPRAFVYEDCTHKNAPLSASSGDNSETQEPVSPSSL